MLKKLVFSSAFILMISDASAADLSRYPNGNLQHTGTISGEVSGVFKDWLPLSLQYAIDPTFDADQTQILSMALKIFMERGVQKHVLDCAFRNSSKDLPGSRKKIELQLTSALTFLEHNTLYFPSMAFISRYWGDPHSVGLGYVGLFYDEDKPLPGHNFRHYLHVAINSDHLGDTSKYRYRNNVEYWAGVIGHEFLHNLGYRHPTGYSGSFISEYGQCITSNGLEAAALEGELQDTEVFKHM